MIRLFALIAAATAIHVCAFARTDSVTFGDVRSEQAHGVCASNAPAEAGALGESCRRIGPNGFLAFNLPCDPARQNYLTVKFWGSDASDATIFVFNGDKRVGNYGDSSPELDLGGVGAPFPTASTT